jgi:hypothetical protein
MTTLTETELHDFLAKTAIVAANPERGIGRQLTYEPPAPRIIVIHFGPEDWADYVSRIVSIVLSFEDAWLLISRHGSASQLRELTTHDDAEALMFAAAERERLAAYVCSRDMAMGRASQDIYLVGGVGNILITWDHHTEDEGLSVEVRDVRQSSALLADLNAFGAELEVFYTPS